MYVLNDEHSIYNYVIKKKRLVRKSFNTLAI